MRNLFFTFCFFASFLSYAQDTTIFAPPGATWYYRPWTPGPDTGLYTFTATHDTLLDGWNARVLQCAVWMDGMQLVNGLNKYVATQGETVYYRVAGEFVLLFDFGAQAGDTITSQVEHFPIFDGCVMPQPGSVRDFRYRIDSVSTIVVDGVVLRVQHTSTIHDNLDAGWTIGGLASEGLIIERIGPANTAYWWGRGHACILAGLPGYLRCYTDGEIHYQPPLPPWGSGGACDYVSIEEPAMADLKITPNPAISSALLPFAPDRVLFFNTVGQQTDIPVAGAILNVSSLAPGLYCVMAKKDGQWYTGRLAVGM